MTVGVAVATATLVASFAISGSDDPRRDAVRPVEPPRDVEDEVFPPRGNRAWTRMPPPPAAPNGAAVEWIRGLETGKDLIVWGGEGSSTGYIWDGRSGEWTEMAESPLGERPYAGADLAPPTGEFLVWGGQGAAPWQVDGAAYDVRTDSWRALPSAPIPTRSPVCGLWTDAGFFVWGSRLPGGHSVDGAIYDPRTDSWREIADAPQAIDQGQCVWVGDGLGPAPEEVIIFGSTLDSNNRSDRRNALGLAFDPASDTWRKLPPVDLSPQATSIAWTAPAEELLAWDYELNAAAYDIERDRWRKLPAVPGDFSECYPTSTTVNAYVMAWYCGRGVLWNFLRGGWAEMEPPPGEVPLRPITAGEVVAFVGETRRFEPIFWIYVASGR